jgi:alpha-1,6-mannosyltransferase
MRIVQLANFYSESSGGLRTALRSLAFHYSAQGHEVIRIVPGATAGDRHDGTARVIEIAAPSLGRTGYRIIRNTSEVTSLLHLLRPDAIELSDKTTLVGPAATMRSRGTRVVLLSHERLDAILRPRVPKGVPLRMLADVWNRRLAERVDDIVCASAFAAQEFARIGVRNVHRIPFGVDLDMYCPAGVDTHGPTTEYRLAMVGRLSAEKSPEVGVDAVRHLVGRGIPVHLSIAGTGPMLEDLQRRANGLPVTFLGHLSGRQEIVDLLRSAHVALAPCGAETFGLAALEAMACGTPVVAAASGALPELVAPGTGTVAAADGPSFAAAIIAVGATDRRIAELFTRAHASRFPWSTTAEAILDVMRGELPRSRERGATPQRRQQMSERPR